MLRKLFNLLQKPQVESNLPIEPSSEAGVSEVYIRIESFGSSPLKVDEALLKEAAERHDATISTVNVGVMPSWLFDKDAKPENATPGGTMRGYKVPSENRVAFLVDAETALYGGQLGLNLENNRV